MEEEGVHCNILLIYQNSFEEKLEILLCSAKANEICQLQKEGKGIRGNDEDDNVTSLVFGH